MNDVAQLRAALVTAAGEPRRRLARRRQLLRGGTLAALVLAVTGLLVAHAVSTAPPTAADVQVIETADSITVRITDLAVRQAELDAAIHRAGLHVRVREVPTGPSAVGRFVGIDSLPAATLGKVTIETGVGGSPTAFVLSKSLGDPVVLQRGRATAGGDRYAVASDTLAFGESLGCERLVGSDATGARVAIERAGLQARWLSTDGVETPDADLASSARAHWKVVRVAATSSATVDVLITVDGAWPYRPQDRPQRDPRCR